MTSVGGNDVLGKQSARAYVRLKEDIFPQYWVVTFARITELVRV